ncbi:hypothetical protein WH95_01815 [Kiloniella litopenaei]|uniref:Uncharacterized protein n=2 Tax=Kiloniella litopenaei TaxID=1549748 RepID=A0A0M2RDN1_9PROT|nr:hypothetical protein WH95_01815 [Kiloniella litopenaei]
METDDLVDYLLRARQVFVNSLRKKDPPLDERSLLIETANFDEAVRRILAEKSSAATTSDQSVPKTDTGDYQIGDHQMLHDGEPNDPDALKGVSQKKDADENSSDDSSDVSLDSYLSERDQEDEDVILLVEKPLFAEQPLLEKLTRPRTSPAAEEATETFSNDAEARDLEAQDKKPEVKQGTADIGMEQGGINLDDFSPLDGRTKPVTDQGTKSRQKDRAGNLQGKSPNLHDDPNLDDPNLDDKGTYDKRDPSPYVWDSDVDERSGGGFLGFVSGLIVLAVYITLPALALVSPLLTPAMAWQEWVNISILSGVVLIAVFVCALFSRYRFRYALYGGVAFALLSSGAHYVPQVRSFVEAEKLVLPLASGYLIEGYFQLAEESQLPLKTGAVQLQPNELNYSRLQRVNLFVKEVDTWLEN